MTPRNPLASRRSLVALVISGLLTAVLQFAGAQADAAEAALPMAVTATSTSTSTINVAWTPPAGFTSVGWSIYFTDSTGRQWGPTIACSTCTSSTLDGLTAGMRFDVTVVGYEGARTAFGSRTATVQSGGCANVTGTCVDIGATTVGGTTHVAQGILHGTTAATNLAQVSALGVKSWRLAASDIAGFARAKQVGGDITLLLSDPWRGWAGRHGAPDANPWTDWALYRQYVTEAVNWQIYLGQVPAYWEIQNEPDLAGDNYSATQPATRELILEQFRVAHDAIRAILPDARIVGPSLAHFLLRNATAPIDLYSFLDFAQANGLQFDLAWHEVGNLVPGTPQGDPKVITAHVNSVRQLLADRPSLGSPRFLINEYGASWHFDQPGAHVGYFAALETAGVDVAGTSCWPIVVDGVSRSTCFAEPGMLDGLITPNGGKADTYSVHSAYAAMTGPRLQTSTSDIYTSAISSLGADGVIRSLIGRHQSCLVGVDQGCTANFQVAPAGKPVTIALGTACSKKLDVRVNLIADSVNTNAVAPVSVLSTRLNCANGKAPKFTLPALVDGSAYSLVATPAA